MKQKEVAEAIQVSDKAVSRWETGRGIPDIDSLQRLSDFYEISINEILAGRYLNADEVKESSDNNLRRMGKEASNFKKS
ncbi:MAG: helix-turn-helix transcriptional regulator [Acetatifactor sp.]|nr:helix-turn-helix transcriptional regulator [Acetatifactor sp.]